MNSASLLPQETTPTVSVVIPTFNRSEVLINSIESVLKQTYTDYELIIIDDGSTDDTRERLKPYEERIRYFYQANRGATAAQNKGIEVAKGKWVSILASDDLWLPEKLERQIRTLDLLGEEFGACFTDCIFMGNPLINLSVFERAELRCESEFGELLNPFRYIVGEFPAIYVQSLMVMRSLLNEIEGFDEALGVGEDTELVSRLALRTKFCYVSAPLVRIDATPSRSRLTDLIARKSDQVYAWYEHRYRKWLKLNELDRESHQIVHTELRTLYYSWVIEKLRRFDFAGGFEKINEIRRMGHSYFKIGLTLSSRAAKKLSRTVRARISAS